jgi:hypothetical protein
MRQRVILFLLLFLEGMLHFPVGALAGDRKEGTSANGWSFQPLSPPATPALASPWPRVPIDRFILQKLLEKGLSPSPEAEKRALIRRLTFDLHGLPPSPEEVEAFLEDESPDAYERLVDRLLASPRYGERWGRHWLDVVHYGETHGYDKDKRRPHAWPYRDYVIRAFNADMPYARFVEEQLAGDVLYPDDPDGIVALGFIAAGPWDFVGHTELREGTVDKEIARSNDRDDMVTTTMSAFLSVTAHCARCHDHKFDPIPQEDYYALQAVFAGVDRADRPYDLDRETLVARKKLLEEKARLESRQRAVDDAAGALTSAEVQLAGERLDRLQRELAALSEARGETPSPTNGYHSEIASSPGETKWVEVDLKAPSPIDEVRLVPARPSDFPDTPGFGFPLRFRVEAASDIEGARRALLDESAFDFPNPGDGPVVIPGGGQSARYLRVTATRLWKRTGDFVFALAEMQVLSRGKNIALGASVKAFDSIEAGRWGKVNLVDGFSSRRDLKEAPEPPAARERRLSLEKEISELRVERGELLEALLSPALRSGRREVAERLAQVNLELSRLPPQALVYAAAGDFQSLGTFGPPRKPRPIYLLRRGDVKSPGKLMVPGALSCLSPLESRFALVDRENEGIRRAALARWVTDPKNPLTYRSIVNRAWHYHFGRGLVDTPNDFGRMGSLPTHPELLDALALRFLEDGGSLKKLHRLILTSAVYRQSSAENAEFSRRDGDNRWLWRQSRLRLDAESIRDALLFVGGQLDLAMGGPSVDHFYFKDDHSPVYDYARFDVDSPASRRRSIYRFIVRSVTDPMMDCLDCANPSILTPKRTATLTALQALVLLNDPFVLKQCEHFAARLQQDAKDRREQIKRAYLLALGRPPGVDETKLLGDYAQEHGLENACRVIFNSNEFLFVD